MRPRRSSPSSLAVAVIAAVVAGAALLLFMILRSSGGDREDTATAAAKPAARAPQEDPREEARWWLDEAFFDDYQRVRPLSGQKTHDLFKEADRRGYRELLGGEYDRVRRKVYERLLKREPSDPDAHRFFGRFPLSDYPDFAAVFHRLVNAKVLPPDLERFRGKYEGRVRFKPRLRAPALSKEEFDAAGDALDRFRVFDGELRQNPTLRAVFEGLKRVRTDGVLDRYDTAHVVRAPFVLIYADEALTPRAETAADRRRVAEARQALEERLDSFSRLLEDYLAYFRATYMKPLGLKEFEPTQLFFVWVFGDRKTFFRYGLRKGLVHPPGLLGYFDPRSRFVFLYEDRGNRSQVETTLAHELTHQLHWHFSRDPVDRFHNHFAAVQAIWFKEGWAEYLGWCRREGENYRFAQPAPYRMETFRLCRKRNLPFYPLRLFIERTDPLEWESKVTDWWRSLPRNRGRKKKEREALWKKRAPFYLEMLYSEGWLLVKFLYEYGGGKYRARMLEFTKMTLRGYKGQRGSRGYARANEVFQRVFGLESDQAWVRFEKEFVEFIDAQLYAIPPLEKTK